jgi:hypothetical protein
MELTDMDDHLQSPSRDFLNQEIGKKLEGAAGETGEVGSIYYSLREEF